jgi:tellurite resistance protein TehA-like permease
VDASETALQIVFAVGLFAQTGLTQFIYEKWMFSQDSNITIGQPPFLLSVVGWFLLSVLGQQANIDDSWGIALPSFCFGVGAIFYIMVLISVFNRLHENRNKKGSPALTLLIAPPAIAVLAIDGFDGNPAQFSVVAEMWLGWCLMVLLLILKTGPRIAENPKSFGAYWAYVFPLSALATSCIRYAIIRDSTTADIMAVVFMGVAIVALLVVLTRMVVHMILCFQEKERWEDPLLGIYSKEK